MTCLHEGTMSVESQGLRGYDSVGESHSTEVYTYTSKQSIFLAA